MTATTGGHVEHIHIAPSRGHRGGLRADLLTDGRITVGDRIAASETSSA